MKKIELTDTLTMPYHGYTNTQCDRCKELVMPYTRMTRVKYEDGTFGKFHPTCLEGQQDEGNS